MKAARLATLFLARWPRRWLTDRLFLAALGSGELVLAACCKDGREDDEDTRACVGVLP